MRRRNPRSRALPGAAGSLRLDRSQDQTGKANENGDVEQSHHRFKLALDQALMLRGSRDFVSRQGYETFVGELIDQLNAGRRQRLAEELAVLHSLPDNRYESCQRFDVRVDSGSLIHVDRNAYSVTSRLIREKVEVRLYVEHLEVWYAQRLSNGCRDCEAATSTACRTGTSSTGWCASPVR